MWMQDFVSCLEKSTAGHSRVDEAVAVKVQWLPKRIYKCRCDTDDSRDGLKTDKAHCLTLDRFSLRSSFADK